MNVCNCFYQQIKISKMYLALKKRKKEIPPMCLNRCWPHYIPPWGSEFRHKASRTTWPLLSPSDLCHLTFNSSWHSSFRKTGGSSADNGGQALSDPTKLSKVKLARLVLWLQRSRRKRRCACRLLVDRMPWGKRRWSIFLASNSQNGANSILVES